MKYFRVKNWRKHQSYEGRTPDWIKIFRDLLNPIKEPEYAALSDAAKLHLLHTWLLAAGCDGDIPAQWLNASQLNLKGKPRISELVDAGFLSVMTTVNGSVMTIVTDSVSASVSVSDSPSLSQSPSFDKESSFSEIWRDVIEAKVPKPVRKSQAERNFRKSVTCDADVVSMRVALRNYRSSERVNRGYVQDASTFFNNWREWETYVERGMTQRHEPNDAERDAETRQMTIIEAARAMKHSTDPIEQAYLAWVAPTIDARGDRILREDPLTFDEWMQQRKERGAA